MQRGKFIVFEGTDGSGKTTQAIKLYEYLTSMGIPCERTFEPTNRPVGALLRKYLKGDYSTCERTIASLFIADRLDHITNPEGILAKLNAGITVVCDRYYFSSMAYNCISEDIDWVRNLNMAARELLAPDLVLFLSMPIDVMENRIACREYKEIYETPEYQRRVYERYIEAFSKVPDPMVRINCARTIDEVAADVRTAVEELYK